jgi:hypothetical protein
MMKEISLLLLNLASTVCATELKTRATVSTQKPVCTNNNWAPSSALYFLVALALGCLSHPKGSLVFPRSSRIWRLSPLFLLIENAQILIHFFQCVRSQGKLKRKSLRVYAYAILALREGNTWRQGEYDAFFSEEENERFLEEEEDGYSGGLAGSSGVNAVDGNENGMQMYDLEPSVLRLTRRTNTATLEEGRRPAPNRVVIDVARSQVGDPAKISLDDWFTIGRWVPFISGIDKTLGRDERVAEMNAMSALADKKAAQLLDARFRKNLEQVRDFEKGPSYRLIVWIPMVQQLAKSFLVENSGTSFTKFVGWTFLVSFGIMEVLLFAVRKPLDGDDREKALKLLRKWGKMKRVLAPEMKPWEFSRDKKIGMLLEPVAGKSWPFDLSDFHPASALVAIAWIANTAIFCQICNIHPFVICKRLLSNWLNAVTFEHTLEEFFQVSWWWLPYRALLAVWWMLAMSFVLVLSISSVITWLGVLTTVPIFISIGLANLVLKYQIQFSKSPDRQISRFSPAATAITTAVLAFVAYLDLGPSGGLSYDCSTTVQGSFYNLLG